MKFYIHSLPLSLLFNCLLTGFCIRFEGGNITEFIWISRRVLRTKFLSLHIVLDKLSRKQTLNPPKICVFKKVRKPGEKDSWRWALFSKWFNHGTDHSCCYWYPSNLIPCLLVNMQLYVLLNSGCKKLQIGTGTRRVTKSVDEQCWYGTGTTGSISFRTGVLWRW